VAQWPVEPRSARTRSAQITAAHFRQWSETSVQPVHVGGKHREWLGSITRLRKRPVFASKMSTPPRSPVNGAAHRRRPGEKRQVHQCATWMEGNSRDLGALWNALQLCRAGNRRQTQILIANFDQTSYARSEECPIPRRGNKEVTVRRVICNMAMVRLAGGIRCVCGILCALVCAGCGGSTVQTSPPPQPDFALSFSPSSVNITQGTTSSGIQVTVAAVERV